MSTIGPEEGIDYNAAGLKAGINKSGQVTVNVERICSWDIFEQEVKGDNKTTCIEELWQRFPSYTQYEVRSALAKCGLTTKHIESQVRVLNGGEQASTSVQTGQQRHKRTASG